MKNCPRFASVRVFGDQVVQLAFADRAIRRLVIADHHRFPQPVVNELTGRLTRQFMIV